jgi:hypothetical protein
VVVVVVGWGPNRTTEVDITEDGTVTITIHTIMTIIMADTVGTVGTVEGTVAADTVV